MGNELAESVKKILNLPMRQLSGNISVSTVSKQLPLDISNPQWQNNGQTSRPLYISELHIGDNPTDSSSWTLIAVSDEMVSEYTSYFQSNLPYPNVSMMGYTNNISSYIPTQRMINADYKVSGCSLSPYNYEGYGSFVLLHSGRPFWTDDNIQINNNTLLENFNDYDPLKWYYGTFLENKNDSVKATINRQLIIYPSANLSGENYNGIYSVNTYNLTNKSLSIQLIKAPSTTENSEFYLAVIRTKNSFYRFLIKSGNIYAEYKSDSTGSLVNLGNYNPSQNYLRIRHDDIQNMVFWETSSDYVNWTILHSLQNSMPWTAMRAELSGGTDSSTINPGVILVDNVNIQGNNDNFEYLYDNFNDNNIELSKWNNKTTFSGIYNPNVLVTEQNGMLSILPISNTSDLHYNGYSSVNKFDLSGQSASIEIIQQPNPNGNTEFSMIMVKDLDNYYGFNIQAGQLRVDKRFSGVTSYLISTVFSPTSYRYLRIRHDNTSNLLIWETSADSKNWNLLYSLTPDFSLDAINAELIGGSYRTETNVSPILIDNFNVRILSLFSDDFDDNTTSTTKWLKKTRFDNIFNPELPVSEENGQLVIEPLSNKSGPHYNGYTSLFTYDFENSYAFMEIVQGPPVNSTEELSFNIVKDINNYYAYNLQAGVLRADIKIAGITSYHTLTSYNPSDHRYLRLRHNNGSILWEVSTNGLNWNVLYTASPQFDHSDIYVEIFGGTYVPVNNSGIIKIDNFNIVPTLQLSHTIASQNKEKPYVGACFPNPAKSKVFFELELSEPELVSVEILNMLNILIANPVKNVYCKEGKSMFDIDISNCQPGIYICRVIGQSFSSNKKILIIR